MRTSFHLSQRNAYGINSHNQEGITLILDQDLQIKIRGC